MRLEATVPTAAPDIVKRPLQYIEGLFGAASAAAGAYLISPLWLHQSDGSGAAGGAASALPTRIFVVALGVWFLLSGISVLYGLWRPSHRNFRMWGLLSLGLALIFTTSLSLIANGPIPPSWLFPMVVGFSSLIIFFRMRYEDKANGSFDRASL